MTYNIEAAEQHRVTMLLGPSFSEAELKISYRKLMRQWHPDRHMSEPQAHAEATERSKLINIAYEFLSELLERSGGMYRAPATRPHRECSWSDLQPKRTYEGKAYTVGFPDASVTEIFLKSSHIVSTGYHRATQTLYIKFSGGSVYRYFGVPSEVFDAFVDAPSHGRFGHRNIYPRFRQERC